MSKLKIGDLVILQRNYHDYLETDPKHDGIGKLCKIETVHQDEKYYIRSLDGEFFDSVAGVWLLKFEKFLPGQIIYLKDNLIYDLKYGGISFLQGMQTEKVCVKDMDEITRFNANNMFTYSIEMVDFNKTVLRSSNYQNNSVQKSNNTDSNKLENLNNKINNNSMINIIEEFKMALKSEPEKSLMKASIINNTGDLTQDGSILFINWLFAENKDRFTAEAVKPFLKEQDN